MENWKSELDALIRDTMVFAAASQIKVSASRAIEVQSAPLTDRLSDPAAPAVSLPHGEPTSISSTTERQEIRRRVATFKAHQERWIREREEFANSILMRIAR